MSVTNAVKTLMRYVSDNKLKLSDLYVSTNLQLSLPENVYTALSILNSLCSNPILDSSGGKTIIQTSSVGYDWYYILRQVKHSVRFTKDKFQIATIGGMYFITFKSTKERLVYVC